MRLPALLRGHSKIVRMLGNLPVHFGDEGGTFFVEFFLNHCVQHLAQFFDQWPFQFADSLELEFHQLDTNIRYFRAQDQVGWQSFEIQLHVEGAVERDPHGRIAFRRDAPKSDTFVPLDPLSEAMDLAFELNCYRRTAVGQLTSRAQTHVERLCGIDGPNRVAFPSPVRHGFPLTFGANFEAVETHVEPVPALVRHAPAAGIVMFLWEVFTDKCRGQSLKLGGQFASGKRE